jgi:hypothetical protein
MNIKENLLGQDLFHPILLDSNEEITRLKIRIEREQSENEQMLKTKEVLENELKRLRSYYADLEVEIKLDHQNKLKVVKDLEIHLNEVIFERDQLSSQLLAKEKDTTKAFELENYKKANEEMKFRISKLEERNVSLIKDNQQLGEVIKARDTEINHLREEFEKFEQMRMEELGKIKMNMSEIQNDHLVNKIFFFFF